MGLIAIAAIIIASFAAFLAMLRVWRKVFWGKGLPEDKVPDELVIRKKLMAPSAALILGSLCMFIFSGIVLDVVDSAAEQLWTLPLILKPSWATSRLPFPISMKSRRAVK